MEAAGLGLFMVSAGVFGTLLSYPGSPLNQAIVDPFIRRMLMGLAMGATAVALIYYPWGRQSGAHYNPAITLIFWRLGKTKSLDAAFYIAAQFVGGALGVVLVSKVIGTAFTDPPVNHVATLPGKFGIAAAFAGEVLIAAIMMTMVLVTMNRPQLSRYTGVFAGLLVATFITFEDPLSGMSLNPARTLASALPGRLWDSLWLYFTAPPLGMLLAVELHKLIAGQCRPHCAKLHHSTSHRCIFCGYGMNSVSAAAPQPACTSAGAEFAKSTSD